MIKFLLYNKVVKFLYGVLLLPMCYVLISTLIFVLSKIELSNYLVQYFLFGIITYVLIHFFFYKPISIYVFSHELVHVISAYLCGSKIKKVKISTNQGSVNVDKVNTFIALSPYFVPLYSILGTLVWFVVRFLFKLELSVGLLSFFLGFTIAFHIILTIHAIYLGQQDLKISGWLFSTVLIFILNCIILIALFNVMFLNRNDINLTKDFFLRSIILTYKECYKITVELFKIIFNLLRQK
ncbi:MAG: hypothetical protein NZ928_04750 [Endomicrobia bacterium]|nr:hypothetical protein [Endomicrobiia bacterium]MDW8055657.1 hypothetical protein [Elusimicrobiota bacterium]